MGRRPGAARERARRRAADRQPARRADHRSLSRAAADRRRRSASARRSSTARSSPSTIPAARASSSCRGGWDVTAPLTIRRRASETPVTFIAFDLLSLDGEPTVDLPYEQRRELLLELGLNGDRWQTPRHHVGDGEALLEAASRQGLEGVVAKRLGSAYRPGRHGRDWVKVRLKRRQDFVIGGWMRGQGGRSGRLGSLLLGVWDRTPAEAEATGERQRLVFAGGVGSGLSERTIDQLGELLAPLRASESPFELGIGPKRARPRLLRAATGLLGRVQRVDPGGHAAPAGLQGTAGRRRPPHGDPRVAAGERSQDRVRRAPPGKEPALSSGNSPRQTWHAQSGQAQSASASSTSR